MDNETEYSFVSICEFCEFKYPECGADVDDKHKLYSHIICCCKFNLKLKENYKYIDLIWIA